MDSVHYRLLSVAGPKGRGRSSKYRQDAPIQRHCFVLLISSLETRIFKQLL